MDVHSAKKLLLRFSFLLLCAPIVAEETCEIADDSAIDLMRRFIHQTWSVDVDVEEGVHESTVGLDLYWDKVYVGQVSGLIDDCEQLISLCFGDIFCLLEGKLSEVQAEWLTEQQNIDGWIFPECLERYDFCYDSGLFAVFFRSPPEERDTEFIDLQPRPWMNFEGCLEPEPISGFLNYAHVLTKRGEGDFTYVLDTDGAMCINGWTAEGRGIYDQNSYRYSNLRVVRDFPDRCTRLLIGDTQSFYPRVLTSDRIQGIQYSTHPEIHRNRISYPISEHELFLERDSRVEVWINELQKETINLSAGTHNIRNFPMVSGFNQIRLKITDDLGRIEYRTFDAMHSPTLLCKGISNFTYSLGVEGESDRYTDKLIGAASYTWGITDNWTGRVGGRFDEKHQSAIVGTDTALRLGIVGLDLAGSNSSYGQGAAVEGRIERVIGASFVQGRASYRQKDFLNQFENLDTGRTRGLYQLTYNYTFPGCWGFLQTTAFRENRWADRNRGRYELSWVADFFSHWTVKVAADYDHYRHPQSGCFIILAYHRVSYDVAHRHTVEGRRQGLVFRNTAGWTSDYRIWQLNAEQQHKRDHGSEPWDNLSFTARYQGDCFSGIYTGWWDDVTNQGDISHVVRVEGALACTGGSLGFGPPIRNSWALVQLDEEMGDACYHVNGFGKTCSVKKGRPLVLTPLASYRKIEVNAEPFSGEAAILEPHHFSLIPHYRSGHLLKLKFHPGEEGIFLVTAKMLNPLGEPLKLKGLVLRNVEKEGVIYSFTDDKGEFSLAGLAPFATYRVTVVGDPDLAYRFVVAKENEGNRVALGELSPL